MDEVNICHHLLCGFKFQVIIAETQLIQNKLLKLLWVLHTTQPECKLFQSMQQEDHAYDAW